MQPRRITTKVEGGTSLEQPRSGLPLPAIIGAGVVGLAVIIWLGVRGGHESKAAPTRAPVVATQPAPSATPLAPAAPAAEPTQPRGPNADVLASELQRTLQRQRLWSTVAISGVRIDVRSGSCSDPAIQGPIASAAPRLKAAGLTTLRCVEESGSVVFTRDL
jgi:hypothetical protein